MWVISDLPLSGCIKSLDTDKVLHLCPELSFHLSIVNVALLPVSKRCCTTLAFTHGLPSPDRNYQAIINYGQLSFIGNFFPDFILVKEPHPGSLVQKPTPLQASIY